MDLKICLIIGCFFAIQTPLSLSAPAGKVRVLPYENGQLQLSVDPTATGTCKPDNTKWIILGILCAVILGIVIYCFWPGRYKECKSGQPVEQERILPNEERQNLLEKNISQEEYEQMKEERDFFKVRGYREDIVLDPKTAHPRLEVSEDGDSVTDSGNVLRVPNSEGRFDSHMFVLGKKGFSTGSHYWEVEVGQKKNWDLGIASESVSRKGKITLAPQNGYWVIGLDGRNDYWARTDPWTCLKVSGKPTKIGIFLDISDAELSLYDVNRKSKLYTFTIPCLGTFYPFFSMGSVTAELDRQPLKILKKPEE